MADAIVSVILDNLISVAVKDMQHEAGLELEVEKLCNNLVSIQAVLVDAEQRQMKDRLVKLWLDHLKDISYDIEEVLDKWNTANLKLKIEGDRGNALVSKKKEACFSFPFPCFGFIDRSIVRRDVFLKIKALNERLDDISRQRDMFNFRLTTRVENQGKDRYFTSSFVDTSEICGRDDEKNLLVSMLCESSEDGIGLQFISIVGMGGIGKTTLAQSVYNDDDVSRYFDIKMWVCVSDSFDLFRIAKSIIACLTTEFSSNEFRSIESLLSLISQSIVGKKFFLVLDDVWTEDDSRWEPLRYCLNNGLHGSKILITTRNESVAHVMESIYVINLKELSDHECWSLFSRIAFSDRFPTECEELEEIGREIVRKCKGLPLAVKIIGSALRFKRTKAEWQWILHSEMWQLEEFERAMFYPLWLSYIDLPPQLRQCFSYCAIFPEDYQINKDELIKLWMAQGYLGAEEDREIEENGEKYFDLLVTRSWFQEFETDDDGRIIRCKMHDIVHDFVQYLANNECSSIEVNDDVGITGVEKLRHSMLILSTRVSFPDLMCSAKKLRSLLIQYGTTNCSSISEVLPKLFDELKSLRALDLKGQLWFDNVVIKIPKEIGKLILLRYLNFSLLKMDELPEELCELYNLQTLELRWCTNLKKLPQGMGNLINLRHLVNDGTSLSYMPKGIERLTCLRTLSEFIVSSGSTDDDKACKLECLKNLNYLRGSLCIKKLGNVKNVGEVKVAELKNKTGLVRLCLNFDAEVSNEDEVFLEALQPPESLQSLEIRDYKGNFLFPSRILSLSKLQIIGLYNCINCQQLPPFGNLPSLESLSICSMWSVKSVDNQFLGINSEGASSSTSSNIPFPKLKSLKFVNMEEWEDWNCGVAAMPCLCSLSFTYCPKLKALPDNILRIGTLKELNVNWCRLLKERYNRQNGEDWHKISRVPNIMINFDYVQGDGH